MLRYALAVMTVTALAGCSTGGGSSPLSHGPSSEMQPQLAAYAASTQYPTDLKATTDLPAAATVSEKDKTITIRNFSDETLRNANVWINGNYVRQVDVIPGHGSVTVSWAQFYNRVGQPLTSEQVSVTRVQLQTQKGLYNLQGPQYD